MMNEHTRPVRGDDLDKIERGQLESAVFAGRDAIAPAGASAREPHRARMHDAPVAKADLQALAALWAAVKRLPSYVRLAAALARDPHVPPQAKASLAVGGLYAISPIDLVPGFIPVFGQLDDLYVLLSSIQFAVRSTPAEVMTKHFERAGVTSADIETDLATVRLVVKKAAARTVKVGGKVLSRAGDGVSLLVKKTMNRRGGATHEQKSF